MRNFLLYSIGLAVGAFGVLGWLEDLEFVVWLAIAIFVAIIISGEKTKSPIIKSISLGFSWALGEALIKSLFFSDYLRNNPEYANSLESIPPFVQAAWMPLLISPIIGLVLSLVLALSLGVLRQFR